MSTIILRRSKFAAGDHVRAAQRPYPLLKRFMGRSGSQGRGRRLRLSDFTRRHPCEMTRLKKAQSGAYPGQLSTVQNTGIGAIRGMSCLCEWIHAPACAWRLTVPRALGRLGQRHSSSLVRTTFDRFLVCLLPRTLLILQAVTLRGHRARLYKSGESRSRSPWSQTALRLFQGGRNLCFLAQAPGCGNRSLQSFR